MYYIAAQVIGFIGTGLFVFSYQCKDSRKLLLGKTCLVCYQA